MGVRKGEKKWVLISSLLMEKWIPEGKRNEVKGMRDGKGNRI